MAITSYLTTKLDKETNTFGEWFERTNLIADDLGTRVLSAETTSAGGSTTGNTTLVGKFSANTVAAGTELRGGTVTTPAPLNITSNTNITAASGTVNTTDYTISSNTFVISSDAITATTDTFSVTSTVGTTLNANTVSITATSGTDITGALEIDGVSTFLQPALFDNTDYIKFPVGTTAQRPDIPLQGAVRFNTSLLDFEGYDGSEWGLLSGGPTSGSIHITNETTNATRYIGFLDNSTGSLDNIYVTSNKLYFNPSTGSLNATEFNSLSDVAYKQDVVEIDNSLELLGSISSYSFKWKDTGRSSYGVIAQELEKILPDLVNESENGQKTVSYIPLIALLIDAVKELNARIK